MMKMTKNDYNKNEIKLVKEINRCLWSLCLCCLPLLCLLHSCRLAFPLKQSKSTGAGNVCIYITSFSSSFSKFRVNGFFFALFYAHVPSLLLFLLFHFLFRCYFLGGFFFSCSHLPFLCIVPLHFEEHLLLLLEYGHITQIKSLKTSRVCVCKHAPVRSHVQNGWKGKARDENERMIITINREEDEMKQTKN